MLLTPDELTAKYVLQITLTYRKGTMNRLGSVHVFKKGGWFGHADHLLKWCPHGTCTGLISDTFSLTQAQVNEIGEDKIDSPEKWPLKYRYLYENWYQSPTICPKCGKPCKSIESLPDSYGFNLPEDRIAKKMENFFHELGGNCDVYLVRNKHYLLHQKERLTGKDPSISKGARAVQSEAQRQQLRNSREKVFYPLKSILADSAGGGVYSTFKSLLGA